MAYHDIEKKVKETSTYIVNEWSNLTNIETKQELQHKNYLHNKYYIC